MEVELVLIAVGVAVMLMVIGLLGVKVKEMVELMWVELVLVELVVT